MANVNKADRKGMAPLWIASYWGHSSLVKLLLEARCEVDSTDTRGGSSPLWVSCRNCCEGVVKLLVQASAGLNKTNIDRQSPVYPGQGESLLWSAAKKGFTRVTQVLLHAGADYDLVSANGQSPLCLAAARGFVSIVRLLLASRADKEQSTKDKQSPLWLAAANANVAVVRSLLQARANVSEPDLKGDSPLAVASAKGHVQVARMLQEAVSEGVDTVGSPPRGPKRPRVPTDPVCAEIESRVLAANYRLVKTAAFTMAEVVMRWQKQRFGFRNVIFEAGFLGGKMSITVDVGLLSGKTATVKAALDEEVGALKRRAQIALGVGGGRLVDSSGSVLDACAPIKCTRLQNGDLLALHINRIQVQACRLSFAAILGDGSVVTWGDAEYGGDSSAVQDQLKNVQQIQASDFAFAAVLADGSVVTWGDADDGGDSSAVQDQLKNVQQIQASDSAFAAILGDGSVVTWGSAGCGGDSSAVQDQLKNVQQIQASDSAFAAVLADGSVVTWGDADDGGDSSAVQDQLKNVQQIQASDRAFAAIRGDGSVVTWGSDAHGGDSSAVQCWFVRHLSASVEHFDVGEKSSSSSEEDEETRHQRSELRAQHAALERCEAELGACLWIDTNRAALLALEAFRPSYLGCRALELGAGAGACGIALAYDGADVTISDVDALLPLMQRNLQLNRLPAVRKTAEAEAGGYATSAVAGVEGAAAVPRF
ncbi:Ankyrin repeat and KH domain-containing protein mask [Symbiodinium microadriaticum]|uniref:Ankyrin repeat and KH domain-containing protein mask n=1 Tax=Symbiodinium microadriaticum TaxID=2951 RepID=A0A1Q9DRS8_SYMMI|nr:Ankyrin repeat and KH domain-containing protein mask [Symbiodinium microadriaticum]